MIEINNLTKNEVDERFLKGVAKRVLKWENRKEIDLSIVLVGGEQIQKLNKKYRRKNRVTDVLSFGDGLNEIVICPGEAKKNIKKYQTTFKKELARILIHGILHLLGYEHKRSRIDAKKMREKEEFYLLNILNNF